MCTNDYDQIPYNSKAYPASHPATLYTMGKLFGMNPADITGCRVLELGCASGGNLIPMAYHLPRSEFLGIDLSRRQVEEGQRHIKELGLKNIRIEYKNILEVDPAWGIFDYIICHGVFSWVPDDVREKILQIISTQLSSMGIAYISYNTYPGWHINRIIRDILLYHTREFDNPRDKIEHARKFLNFLVHSSDGKRNPYQDPLLKNIIDIINELDDSYLYHEYLESINNPLFFHQFIHLVSGYNLQYLGESALASMMPVDFDVETIKTLSNLSKENIIISEQYMDFLKKRSFRCTLLCRREIDLKRTIEPDEIQDFLVTSFSDLKENKLDLSLGVEQTFTTSHRDLTTGRPIMKAIMVILNKSWPKAMEMATLYGSVRDILIKTDSLPASAPGITIEIFLQEIRLCLIIGMVEFHTWQADFTNTISDYPKVSELAVYQTKNSSYIANNCHYPIKKEKWFEPLFPLLDGMRNKEKILEEVKSLKNTNHLSITDMTDEEFLDKALYWLLEKALLVK